MHRYRKLPQSLGNRSLNDVLINYIVIKCCVIEIVMYEAPIVFIILHDILSGYIKFCRLRYFQLKYLLKLFSSTWVARHVAHPHGQNRSQDPMGLSSRESFKNGCNCMGELSTRRDAYFILLTEGICNDCWDCCSNLYLLSVLL